MFKLRILSEPFQGSGAAGKSDGSDKRDEGSQEKGKGRVEQDELDLSIFLEEDIEKLADKLDNFADKFDNISDRLEKKISERLNEFNFNVDADTVDAETGDVDLGAVVQNYKANGMDEMTNEIDDMVNGSPCEDEDGKGGHALQKNGDIISKKELLKILNISYGQLYRWKREGLIPDEWFVKQSVSTGQETFFRREQIINRIKQILDLKDNFNLENIKDIVAPVKEEESKPKSFSMRTAMLIHDIDPFILREYAKTHSALSVNEAAILYLISLNRDIIPIDAYSGSDFSFVDEEDFVLIVTDSLDNQYLVVGSDRLFDNRLKITKKFNIGEAAKTVMKLAAEVENG